MNKISDEVHTGTIGELLVQIRLLQYGVQAAPPLKDSGNDLIAICGKVSRAIQVKTTTKHKYNKGNLNKIYNILAVVELIGDDREVLLDESNVFLIPQDNVKGTSLCCEKIHEYLLTQEHIDQLF